MNRFLVWALVVIPFIEIWTLIGVGRLIGGGWVVVSLLLAALFGAALIRHAGGRALASIGERVRRGESPGEEMVHGALLLLSGLLWIIPGYLTDLIASLLLTPWFRQALGRWLSIILQQTFRPAPHPDHPSGMTIEGETVSHHKETGP